MKQHVIFAVRVAPSPNQLHAQIAIPAPPPTPWIRETAFGTWFIGTKMWRHNVLRPALIELQRLAGAARPEQPVILDVGCGGGRALRLLDILFRPSRLIGLDIDRRLVCNAGGEARRCRAGGVLVVADAGTLPIANGSVDVVVCHQTFHHLVDHERAAREFLRVLKPGGLLLFAESCRRYIYSLPIRILFRHPMRIQKSAREYLGLLRTTGFEVPHDAVSLPSPWWSQPDLGLFAWFRGDRTAHVEPTLVQVVARRPLA